MRNKYHWYNDRYDSGQYDTCNAARSAGSAGYCCDNDHRNDYCLARSRQGKIVRQMRHLRRTFFCQGRNWAYFPGRIVPNYLTTELVSIILYFVASADKRFRCCTIRGKVHDGTSQQGDWPTIRYRIDRPSPFFCAHLNLIVVVDLVVKSSALSCNPAICAQKRVGFCWCFDYHVESKWWGKPHPAEDHMV